MQKYPAYIFLIAIIISSCTTVEKIEIKESESPPAAVHSLYADRIYPIITAARKPDETAIIIRETIDSASAQNYDAVLLKTGIITKSIFEKTDKEEEYLDLINSAGESAQSKGLFLFVEIDFNLLTKTLISASAKTAIKNNIKSLVSKCRIDGFYFTGIDFQTDEKISLFEDIVVESMLIKPFLIVSAPGGIGEKDAAFVNSYLEKGVIDFLINAENSNSVLQNSYINPNENGKFLNTYLKRISPRHFISLNLSGIADSSTSDVFIINENLHRIADSAMRLNFILTGKTDSLKLKIGGVTRSIPTEDWVIPFNYFINKDNSASRYGSWIEFRRPFAKITSGDTYNLLCRTQYPAKAFINDDSVKIYKTGVFFNKIKLNDGLNRIRAEVKSENGETAVYEDRVLRIKPESPESASKLAISDNSIEPSENVALLRNDKLTVSFNGTRLQSGFVEINPGGFVFECVRNDFRNFSKYQAQISLSKFAENHTYSIKLFLKPNDIPGESRVEKLLDYSLVIKNYEDFPLLKTTDNSSLFAYTLAPVRLGAPLRNELPKDVILKSSGIFGDYYRIHLSDEDEGYISKEYVKEMPPGTQLPGYYINPISSFTAEDADIIRIPYPENVPFEVYPDPHQKRLIINLYGVKTSSTWIIHRNKLRYIKEVTWEQAAKETYRIYVNLKTSKIWGYTLKPNGKELILKIKYPPVYNLKSDQPLKGIKISLEAGHGGNNYGAVGLSGLKEKDINLKLCALLETLLKKQGAEVLQVRDSDKYMTLTEKRDIVTDSDANIHLSVHANASDPEKEFLGASGTCTFYNNPFWAKFSEKIYKRLTELNLKPFGSVGSFNYRVTRMSDMPAVLVEQAFMSHAEDEEKLFDDDFRSQMAEKIYLGIIDYLKYMGS